MKHEASKEQRDAIESTGGVILEAGAGSGKTFVIVGHLINKISSKIEAWKEASDENASKEIEKFLVGIVVITFTRKAAGELEIRVKNALEELYEDSEGYEKEFWSFILKSYSLIFIGTIDSFCKRISSFDNFPRPLKNSRLADAIEIKNLIREKLESLKIQSEIKNRFFSLKLERIVESLFNIFSDPMKRLSCEKASDEENVEEKVQEIYQLLFLREVLNGEFGEIDSSKAWGKLLQQLVDIRNESNFYSKFISVIGEIKRVPSYRGKDEGIKSVFDQVKMARKTITDFSEDIEYIQSNEGEYKSWSKFYKFLFDTVSSEININSGLNFADIEYQVYSSLKNSSFLSFLTDKYKYFIVDEFQDTSPIQFNIILDIAGKDNRRLFLVGDIKQAIYGFRGGDSKLFVKSIESFPKHLMLQANYRSSELIVKFNNSIFETLNSEFGFNKGLSTGQKPQASRENQGVFEVVAEIPDMGSDQTKTLSVDLIEAKIISKIAMREIENQGKLAVLYRNLKPSFILMCTLEKSNIAYRCQFKYSIKECPIYGIFLNLCKWYKCSLEDRREISSLLYLINEYFAILGEHNFDLELKLSQWQDDIPYLGVYYSFIKFFKNLNLFSEKFSFSLQKIKSLCHISNDKIETILARSKELAGEVVNFDHQFGANPRVEVMTVHASKGLEFEAVFLAGTYTNSPIADKKSVLSDSIASFKWMSSTEEEFSSLNRIIEKIKSNQKDMSEEIRLMYVACTRAKDRLYFTSLPCEVKPKKNSWKYTWDMAGLDFDLVDQLSISIEEELQNKLYAPMFHKDKEMLVRQQAEDNRVLIAPELSVTSLLNWRKCPELFYLKHVYKLDGEMFKKTENTKKNSDIFKSSAKRGIQLHGEIESYLRKRELNNESKFSWLNSRLGKIYLGHDLEIEKELKFEFGGQVISGTPDLLGWPKNENDPVFVWDHKTGNPDQNQIEMYFYQLIFYALGTIELFPERTDRKKYELSLILLDKKEVVSKTFSKEEIYDLTGNFWSGFLTKPYRNTHSCDSCDYYNICHQNL